MNSSLSFRKSPLSDTHAQLKLLNDSNPTLAKFEQKLQESGLYPLRATGIEIFQINLGKMCNQVCKHCHVDAGPNRKEIMTRETLESCLIALDQCKAHTVDLTGGAPEMNSQFRWFVEEVRRRDKKVMVRSNLTIFSANKSYNDLPDFYSRIKAHVVASLPYYDKKHTDRQRGDGVFEKSIDALQQLNEVGYAKEGTGLYLDLVYNPVGAFLPAREKELEADFRRELRAQFGIEFSALHTITNMPISRYLEFLWESGNLESYMEKLVNAYNPAAAEKVMCRNTISIGWDGYLYDCDFNQMLDMKISSGNHRAHIKNVDWNELGEREILINQHCFGCTAGTGSSCGGSLT